MKSEIKKLEHGIVIDLSHNIFPTMVYGWDKGIFFTNATSTFCGYVISDFAKISTPYGEFILKKGMYFSCPFNFEIKNGRGIVIETFDYNGVFVIGGPVEKTGRLKYIDGCTDSLLIPPVTFGDSCLNVLFFPKNIVQTPHTHPSFRTGLVIDGKGLFITPTDKLPLKVGDVFYIPENGIHSFNTDDESHLTVIAFHPDSDFGPQNDEHPMINRTIVDGKSAKFIPKILTK